MKADQETPSKLQPIGDSTWFDREVGWLRMNARKARWISFAVLCALGLYLIVVARFAAGPINVFHNDALLFLDDGWRVLNGQVPHRDFYSPLGPLEFLIVGGGMLLARQSAHGLAISIAIFGAVIGFWGWILSRRRMPAFFALLVTAWLVLTAACPMPLGFDPAFFSCAMIYNRQGYALLGIVLVECAFAHERSRFEGGLSSGVALVLLGFLKLNFFGMAGLFLLATIPRTRTELPRVWGFLAGVAGTGFAVLLYLRFSIAAFISDMVYAIHARGASMSGSGMLDAAAKCFQSGTVWMVLTIPILILLLSDRSELWSRQNVALILLSAMVLASGPFFLQTNAIENRNQMASLWLILLLERVSAIHLQKTKYPIVTVATIAVCLGGLAAVLIPDVMSGFELASIANRPSGSVVAAAGMEDVRFYDSTSFYDHVRAGDGDGTYYANCLNDGLTLLTSQSRPAESILSLGFHNPFSYLLRRKPAEGGSAFLGVGNSISKTQMPKIDQVFGNADLMVLPEYEGTHRPSDEFIQNYYGSYLRQNFHFVAKSQCWALYRRNR